jgi:hypothetical protein
MNIWCTLMKEGIDFAVEFCKIQIEVVQWVPSRIDACLHCKCMAAFLHSS